MEIKIKKYSNGSYSYYCDKVKHHVNMNKELAEKLIELKGKGYYQILKDTIKLVE